MQGLSGMMLSLCGYIFLLFAFGGSRSHESGKDATIIGGVVLSFFVDVGVSPFLGLGTIM